MNDPTTPVSPVSTEELLRHREWLRRLAARLVTDEADAEDAVQQTWLAALRHRPRAGAPVKGWLATVLRNAVRKRHRETTRRNTRERTVATVERDVGPAETAERFELQRLLVEEVAKLDEPYRMTVLLRFFEDMPPREIAMHLDVPLKTVESRLGSAQRKLRERMDALHGGNRVAWTAPLAPGALRAAAGGGAATVGGIAAMKLVQTVAAAVAIVGIAAWIALGPPAPGDARPERATARFVDPDPVGPPPAPIREVAATVDAESADPGPVAPIDEPDPDLRPGGSRLVIRIRDPAGAVASNIRTYLVQNGRLVAKAATDENGESSFDPIGGAVDCAVWGGSSAPNLHRLDASAGVREIQLPAGAPCGGTVLVDGRPPSAPLRILLKPADREHIEAAFSTDLWNALAVPKYVMTTSSVLTDRDGRFAFAGFPPGTAGELRVYAEGYIREDGGDPRFTFDELHGDVELRLSSLPRLVGRIVDAAGRPVADHRMSIRTHRPLRGGTATQTLRTDEEGRFDHRLHESEVSQIVLVAHDTVGGGGARFTFAGPFESVHELGDLRLDAPVMLTLRVVDRHDRPIAGARVGAHSFWDESSASTDERGEVEVSVAPFVANISISAPGYEVAELSVGAVRAPDTVVTLTPATTLLVRLAGPPPFPFESLDVEVRSTERLFTDASVELHAPPTDGTSAHSFGHGEEGSRASYSFDQDGRCRITRLPAQVPFELTVRTSLGVVLVHEFIALEPAEARDVVVPFEPGRRVTGTIVDPAGRPIGRALVTLANQAERRGRRVHTDKEGRFTFDAILASTALLLVERGGFAPARLDEFTVPDEGLVLTVRLEPGRSVDVTVVDARGAPIDGLNVRAESTTPDFLASKVEGETSIDGRTTLHDLPTGSVNVSFEDAGVVHERLLPAGVGEARFVVPTTGAVVAHWSTSITTDPDRHGELRLSPLDGEGATIVADRSSITGSASAGTVTLPRAIPGRYRATLELRHLDRKSTDILLTGNVTVVARETATVVWE